MTFPLSGTMGGILAAASQTGRRETRARYVFDSMLSDSILQEGRGVLSCGLTIGGLLVGLGKAGTVASSARFVFMQFFLQGDYSSYSDRITNVPSVCSHPAISTVSSKTEEETYIRT